MKTFTDSKISFDKKNYYSVNRSDLKSAIDNLRNEDPTTVRVSIENDNIILEWNFSQEKTRMRFIRMDSLLVHMDEVFHIDMESLLYILEGLFYSDRLIYFK